MGITKILSYDMPSLANCILSIFYTSLLCIPFVALVEWQFVIRKELNIPLDCIVI